MIKTILAYFGRLVDKSDPTDLRHFMLLCTFIHWLIGSFLALFAKSILPNTELIAKYIDYDFVILMAGLFNWTVLEIVQVRSTASMFRRRDINVESADNINLTDNKEEVNDI